MAQLTREDHEQIAAFRARASEDETARFAAELYKLRNTTGAGILAGFPKYIAVVIALWFALLETADKLPQLMLSYPRYEAALAEVQAKIMQPDLLKAQIAKAENDAAASVVLPDQAKVQLERNRFETKAAALAPDLATANLAKAQNDAAASAVLPDQAKVQLEKTRFETKAASLAPDLATANLSKAQSDAKTAAVQPGLTQAQLDKVISEVKTAALQPDFTKLQIAKLGVDTKLAFASLPGNLQAAGFNNNLVGFFGPLLQGILGGSQQPPPQDQAPAQPSTRSAPSSTRAATQISPTARADALWEKGMALFRSGRESCEDVLALDNETRSLLATGNVPAGESRSRLEKFEGGIQNILQTAHCPR